MFRKATSHRTIASLIRTHQVLSLSSYVPLEADSKIHYKQIELATAVPSSIKSIGIVDLSGTDEASILARGKQVNNYLMRVTEMTKHFKAYGMGDIFEMWEQVDDPFS